MNHRGIYEKVSGSGIWWIHWYDAQGRRHREKVGTKSTAIALYRKRKTELERRKLPEKLRQRPVLFRKIAEDALQYSSRHKRSARDDRCRMSKLLEWFSDREAESITPPEIEEHFHGAARHGKSLSCSAVAHLPPSNPRRQGEGEPSTLGTPSR